ncbi:hypothetical protein QBC38DRAFT_280181 [Podospora fimiseda]|uniref:Uncharacterized protein n=1 Tax=Podospora fimiseda TaxID=252190 RepID=A0AAN7H0K1_9PEZI|nr:hypothetical protein QBC38DRAFT_280181 [Podospora fimiseda]
MALNRESLLILAEDKYNGHPFRFNHFLIGDGERKLFRHWRLTSDQESSSRKNHLHYIPCLIYALLKADRRVYPPHGTPGKPRCYLSRNLGSSFLKLPTVKCPERLTCWFSEILTVSSTPVARRPRTLRRFPQLVCRHYCPRRNGILTDPLKAPIEPGQPSLGSSFATPIFIMSCGGSKLCLPCIMMKKGAGLQCQPPSCPPKESKHINSSNALSP